MAEFDCYFCYMQIAKQFNFAKPVITTDSQFMIKDGTKFFALIFIEIRKTYSI